METAASDLHLEDGKLVTEAVEVNAAWHCNINCRWCSHASPTSQVRYARSAEVGAGLAVLASFMRVDHMRLLGGEPLLHPDLVELVEVARSSGITETVRVLTNGLLLHTVPVEFWRLVDEVHVSVYPSTAGAIARRVDGLREAAAAGGARLKLLYFDRFRVAYRAPGQDGELTERIYRTCQIGNVWRCLTLEAGRLYRCPQAAHVHLSDRYKGCRSSHGADYLEVDRIASVGELVDWLVRPEPLASCQVCAGSVGGLQPHRQLKLSQPEEPSPDVDAMYLDLLERDPDAGNSCVAREEVVWEPV
jgi:organic radical activating enzyme